MLTLKTFLAMLAATLGEKGNVLLNTAISDRVDPIKSNYSEFTQSPFSKKKEIIGSLAINRILQIDSPILSYLSEKDLNAVKFTSKSFRESARKTELLLAQENHSQNLLKLAEHQSKLRLTKNSNIKALSSLECLKLERKIRFKIQKMHNENLIKSFPKMVERFPSSVPEKWRRFEGKKLEAYFLPFCNKTCENILSCIVESVQKFFHTSAPEPIDSILHGHLIETETELGRTTTKMRNFLYNSKESLSGVRNLNLSGLKLESIPPEIQFFSGLTRLSLSNNNISCIEDLNTSSKLVFLDLAHNRISDFKPLNFPRLLSLNLSFNFISDFSPLLSYETTILLNFNAYEGDDLDIESPILTGSVNLAIQGNPLPLPNRHLVLQGLRNRFQSASIVV